MSKLFIEDDITRAKRGITWIRLEEALSGTGCPVCTEIETTERHYFQSLLHEYVLDAGVRKKLHRQHGFCTRHAKLALTTELALKSDGLHLATMFETVLQEHLKQLENQIGQVREMQAGPVKRRKKAALGPVDADECFACNFLKSTENIALHGLVYFSDDNEFIDTYTRSQTIICYRHIQMIVKEAADPIGAGRKSARVLEVTEGKLKKMKTHLSGFIAKHDHQSKHDYTRDELDSYLDVVKFFSGQMRG